MDNSGIQKNPKIDEYAAIDKKAAKEYNILWDKLYLHPKRIQTLSDGTVVNLMSPKDKVIKKIGHLSETETKELFDLHEELNQLKLKMMVLKKQAFGIAGNNFALAKGMKTILEPVKSEMLEWFGRLYSEEEIHQKLILRGIPSSYNMVKEFRRKNKGEIEKLQSEYEKDWKSVPVARKRARLDQLSYIYNKIKQEFDKASGTPQLNYVREMRTLLDQVRKEVEGEQIKLTVNGQIDINATIEVNKTTEELYSQVNYMSLLIGRVCARFGLNPLILQYRLMNSWYSEHTGFKRNDKFQELKPNYPSAIVYNWDTIKEKHEQLNETYDRLKKQTDIQDATIIETMKEKKLSLKEMMQKKISEMDNAKVNLKEK
jgi:uncharacterized protein YdcH (DUF465 family)